VPESIPEFSSTLTLWKWLTVLDFSLLPHLYLYSQTPDKGKSVLFQGLAVLFTLMAAIVIAITVRLSPQLLARLHSLPTVVYTSAFMICTGVLVIFGLNMRPEWVYAHMGMVLAGTMAVLLWSWHPDRKLSNHGLRFLRAAISLTLGLITVVRLYSLSVYPSLHPIDEPWTLGWAISYVHTGQLSDWIMVDRDIALYKYYVVMGEWLKLTGVGFWRARSFSVIVMLVVFLFTAITARRLYGRQTAYWSGAALFSSAIFLSGARIRHDVGLALSISLSLWLFAEARTRNKTFLHLLAGSVLGLGMFSHYHAAVFLAPMIVSLYGPPAFARLKARHSRPEPGVWLYGFGAVLGLGAVMLLQPLPSSSNEVLNQSATRVIGLHSFLTAFGQHMTNLAHFSPLEFVLIMLAIGAALWRNKPSDWTLLLLVLGLQAGLAFANDGGNFEYYQVQLTPVYGLLVGSLIALGVSKEKNHPSLVAASDGAIFRALILVITLGYTLTTPLSHIAHRHAVELAPTDAAAWVLDHENTSRVIVGDHIHFLWLTNYTYVSPLAPNLMPDDQRAQYESFEDVWDGIHADVFIVDTSSSTYPLLRPLVESGFLEQAPFHQAAAWGTKTIYERTTVEQ